MDLKEIVFDDVDCIHLVQGMVQCRDVVNMVMYN
jgi:hypothetical protein